MKRTDEIKSKTELITGKWQDISGRISRLLPLLTPENHPFHLGSRDCGHTVIKAQIIDLRRSLMELSELIDEAGR